jgi:hypothetical protein
MGMLLMTNYQSIAFMALMTASLAAAGRADEGDAPPPALRGDFGAYRSPLVFAAGGAVDDAAGWPARRAEIRRAWFGLIGAWPPVIERPAVEVLGTERREGHTRRRLRVQVAAGRTMDGYLLVPDGAGPFPAVLVVFYEPETAVGEGNAKPGRDFALQLVRRGFVAMSLGIPPDRITPGADGYPAIQPLSYLAYVAANGYQAMAGMPEVDASRVGVMGHSYGGKWALFASCLYDKFACGVWSDPGVVFDEARPNVNYWEPWYLGWEPDRTRSRGVIREDSPRTGAYRLLVERGMDLHELHALMAPRPFLVSGGSEDPPDRWRALNHAIAVNRLLGADGRVAMTNRPAHDPTPESNAQVVRFLERALRPGAAAR